MPQADGYQRIKLLGLNNLGQASGYANRVEGNRLTQRVPIVWSPTSGIRELELPLGDGTFEPVSLQPFDLADSGAVTGYYFKSTLDDLIPQSIFWNPAGQIIDPPFAHVDTDAYEGSRMNPAGQVVTSQAFKDESGIIRNPRTMLWSINHPTAPPHTLPTTDQQYHNPVALSRNGTILNQFSSPTGGFAYSIRMPDGTSHPIDTLPEGGYLSVVGDSGVTAGSTRTQTETGDTEAAALVINPDASLSHYTFPDTQWYAFTDINPSDQAVGFFERNPPELTTPDGTLLIGHASNFSAMLWDPDNGLRELSELVDLSSFGEGWSVSNAHSINDKGQILATISGPYYFSPRYAINRDYPNTNTEVVAYRLEREQYSVLLDPVPEPTSGVLIGLSVAAMIRRHRRAN